MAKKETRDPLEDFASEYINYINEERQKAKASKSVLEKPKAPAPSEVDPSTIDPAISDPSVSAPLDSDPAKIDPSVIDPSHSAPSISDPSTFDPSESAPSGIAPSKVVDPSETDPSKTDPSTFDPSISEGGATFDPSVSEGAADIDPSISEGATLGGTESLALKIIGDMPTFIISDKTISTTDKVVLLYLFNKTLYNDGRTGNASHREIGETLGLSPNTVRKTLKSLEDAGFIKYTAGNNQTSSGKADLMGLHVAFATDHKISTHLTEFFKWCSLNNCPLNFCGGSPYVWFGMVLINNKKPNSTRGGMGGIDPSDSDGAKSKSNGTTKLRFSSFESMKNILLYGLARGFSGQKINKHAIDWLLAKVNEPQGSYQQRNELLTEFEIRAYIAIEYVREKKAKHEWNYLVTTTNENYISKNDSMEARDMVLETKSILQRYFSAPAKISLTGASELPEILRILGLNEKIDEKTIDHTRDKLKRKIEQINGQIDRIFDEFKIVASSSTEDLFGG